MNSRPPQARCRAGSSANARYTPERKIDPSSTAPSTPECMLAPVGATRSHFWPGVSLRSRSHMHRTPKLRKPPVGVPSQFECISNSGSLLIAPDGFVQQIRRLPLPNTYLRPSRLLLRAPTAIPQLHLDRLNSSSKPSFPVSIPPCGNSLVSSDTQPEHRLVLRAARS